MSEGAPWQLLQDLPAEPWRNGGGFTRTVARHATPEGDLWRVSAAEITACGPFSIFAGMSRHATLIAGGPLCLQTGTQAHALKAIGDMGCFSGDDPSAVITLDTPARLWNVMSRHGQVATRVTLHRHWPPEGGEAQPVVGELPGVVHILLMLTGVQAGALCVLPEQKGAPPWPRVPPEGMLLHTELRPLAAGYSAA